MRKDRMMSIKTWDKFSGGKPKPPRPKEEIIEGIDCSWYKDCIYYKQCKNLEYVNNGKTNFLKWLLKQQYYILPKNIKLKIKEILDYDERTME